ncbi:MAG: GerW family sporulation protein [Blautia sp.]|nr:GerW family sporulation protein [Blautia sp.]
MQNDNSFKATVDSLFKGMDGFLSAKTVVGDAIRMGDTTILPLMDVSFGVGAGAFEGDKKNNGGGGIGGKMSPCALLVLNTKTGTSKLVNIKNQNSLGKVLDMVPDIVNKFAPGGNSGEDEIDLEDSVDASVEEEI